MMDNMSAIYYRAMKSDDAEKPVIGRGRRTLGLKLEVDNADIPVQPNNWVLPKTGGMSVVIDDPMCLPHHRLPPLLGGSGRDPVFALENRFLPLSHHARVDRIPHALIEPRERTLLNDFEAAIESTREHWRLIIKSRR